MQFNTYFFSLVFLPITIIGYYFINRFNYNVAKLFIVTMSMLFYSYAGIKGLIWLVISLGFNYWIVKSILRKRSVWILWSGILANIFLLIYFKYTNFSIDIVNAIFHFDYKKMDIIYPVGISFFTFQQISYLVDTYRLRTKDNSLLDYVLYVTFFPKILMGPIINQSFIIPQFHDESRRKISTNNMILGIQMFIIGLFKKVILADTFSRAVSWAYGIGFENITSMDTFLIMLAYTFQIYFDFSGYSDMSISIAKMLNIDFPINFDSPYKAFSIRDFWRRWHISLTDFLTEYIYIPLGGSRKGALRTYLNVLIVFLISGIWHGANLTFIFWGGYMVYSVFLIG